ncbi:glycosyltransferase family 1 protein [Parabacteroides sp. AF18-52]|jgi:mannosyltransferase|uniref:glycosyltransferase family 4 protein n=1 Tax=Parabacteroides TaxID=375288 RepID=UPI000EFED108|nr:glycosyltransferase family 1 protein [Parabacteroides sp. AF18-52]RHR34436.1 glycosyltransferase family 1 protein [Parabacteroides sp. AF18-52]
MKLAFDAKRITHNATGLGNYSRFIVNSLINSYPENSYHLYSPDKGKEHLRALIPEQENVIFHYLENEILGSLGKAWWRSCGIIGDLKKEKPALFHGLSNELPFGLSKAGIPSVVTIHDLIFIRYPQFYKTIDRNIYNFKFRKACLLADKIVAVSEMTKQDIIRIYKVPEEKIDVVYQGCDVSFLQQAESNKLSEVKNKYNLPEHFILNVGSIEQRKNLLLIVKALKQSGKDIRLIAIGRRTPYTETVEQYIRENNMQEQVTILNNVSFDDLPAFYQLASLFIYPSFFEGFGIPILEALNSGTPVIAATGSCLEEAGGPDSLYINPEDVNDLNEKINWILTTPSQAEHMRTAGKEYAKRFLDQAIAQDIMNVYQKII